jgi:hypothetical protein
MDQEEQDLTSVRMEGFALSGTSSIKNKFMTRDFGQVYSSLVMNT